MRIVANFKTTSWEYHSRFENTALLSACFFDSELYCFSEKNQGLEQDAIQRDPKCDCKSPEAADYVRSPIAYIIDFHESHQLR